MHQFQNPDLKVRVQEGRDGANTPSLGPQGSLPGLKAGVSLYSMIDVGSKAVTERRAIAEGKIRMAREAYVAIREGTNPKGNVLGLAEVAGILFAKKTSDLIPLCHPLPLNQIKLSFTYNDEESSVIAMCEVKTSAKTGVEMEALAGVSGALLSIYDLSKAVNPEITISDIRLVLKEGGKSDFRVKQSFEGIRVSVITISDRVSRGMAQDQSGPAVLEFFNKRKATVSFSGVVPDELEEIQTQVLSETRDSRPHLLITTGGTGLSARDVTPEAIEKISDRVIPGVGECLRSSGSHHTPMAWLSRSAGYQIQNTWVITLPGSVKAVNEGLAALESFLVHGLEILSGDFK